MCAEEQLETDEMGTKTQAAVSRNHILNPYVIITVVKQLLMELSYRNLMKSSL